LAEVNHKTRPNTEPQTNSALVALVSNTLQPPYGV
jgi:hypothetical protein